MARHFASMDEMTRYVAEDVVKKPAAELSLTPMNL